MVSEKTMQDVLEGYYRDKAKYMVRNAFVYNWESDFWILRNNSLTAVEYECKISRSDYFADRKKVEKHLFLSTGETTKKTYTGPHNNRMELPVLRPNQFYYVVPKGLITVDELPPYAGLMELEIMGSGFLWYNPASGTKKRAPFLHKDRLNYEKILCPKFYYYWQDARRKMNEYKTKVDNYERERKNNINKISTGEG